MDKQTYDQHKKTLDEGKIVILGGRTAATLDELQVIARAQGVVPFGTANKSGTETGADVMAIDSGRLTPAQIAEMGESHPLIVASRRLTEPQLDALVDYFADALAPAPADEPDAETPKPAPASGEAVPSENATEQAVQGQIATGANDALTPKTVLDNKTSADQPAGKNASKAQADTVQDEEKAGAKSAA